MSSSTQHETEYRPQGYIQRTYGGWHGLLISRQIRALLGVVLLGLFGLWLVQNDSVPVGDLAHEGYRAVDEQHRQLAEPWKDPMAARDPQFREPGKVLDLPLMPGPIERLLSSYNIGLAGALLLASALYRSNKLALLVLIGAGVMCVGYWFGLERMSPLYRWDRVNLHPTTMVLGAAVSGLGFYLCRK